MGPVVLGLFVFVVVGSGSFTPSLTSCLPPRPPFSILSFFLLSSLRLLLLLYLLHSFNFSSSSFANLQDKLNDVHNQ